MKSEIVNLQHIWLKQGIVSIGAKIATAIELAQKEKAMPADSLEILIQAQLELEDIYIELESHKTGIAKMMILREPEAEYREWIKQELQKSWERRSDPDIKWHTAEEMRAKYGIDQSDK